MVDGAYVPDAGEFIWLSFDPRAGHEQGGRRPDTDRHETPQVAGCDGVFSLEELPVHRHHRIAKMIQQETAASSDDFAR